MIVEFDEAGDRWLNGDDSVDNAASVVNGFISEVLPDNQITMRPLSEVIAC